MYSIFFLLCLSLPEIDISSCCVQQVAIWPALIAAGSALVGGIVNNAMNRDNMDYKAEIQKRQMDYEWERFNSPYAQMQAMGKAGMNPAVGLSQGQTFQSPSAAPPTDSPLMFSGVDEIANAVNAFASAKKAGAETLAQTLENDITKATFADKVKAVGLQNKWTEEQTSNIIQQTSKIVGECNVMQKQVEKLESEKKLTDKEVSWFDRHMSAEIEHLKSTAEYQKAMAGLTESQKKLLDDTMDDLKKLTNLNVQQMEKVVELMGKFGDAQAIVGMVSQVVGSASDLIGTLYGKGILKPKP